MTHDFHTRLPAHLEKLRAQIEQYALDYGLDFFEVIFEVLDWNQVNEVAAYGGFPNRYPHWRFGMEYEQLSKSYAYGLSKIYEMVINNDPCYAYLLHSNSVVDQKLVMAHVYAHCDFFKNNIYFAHTNRKMMDEMANHKTRVIKAVNRYGYDRVEDFIDACLSLETLIDRHAPAIRRKTEHVRRERDERDVQRLHTDRPYLEHYVNPEDFLKEQRRWLEEQGAKDKRFPENPERDVLLFLLENAPLESWESDLLSMIREEAYYFAPQGQTKVMNEGWACLTKDARVFTDRGLITIGELVEDLSSATVFDGECRQRVVDRAIFSKRSIKRIRTRRGFELGGSDTHRLLMNDDATWKRLDEISLGDRVAISSPQNFWPESLVKLTWEPKRRITLHDVADTAGVNISTVIRHVKGTFVSRSAHAIDAAMMGYSQEKTALPYMLNKRADISVPHVVDERLASFLGYLVGDGHISRIKRVIGLTSGDEEQANHFAGLCRDLFGLSPRIKLDGERYRVLCSSEHLREFLESLGLQTGVSARKKCVPEAILRSPKKVVSAFLRALFDCDGYAGDSGVILSTSSTEMSKQVQLLLLNFGILSSRRIQHHDIWNVYITGRSAVRYLEEIGFGLQRKKKKLNEYIGGHEWYKDEKWEDEIVSIEHDTADVYDITVENTHRYAAQGFINHNSFWHSKIMTEKALEASEIIDYADHHSGTVAMGPNRFNPYKIGLELFRDIEERWNKGKFGKEYEECDDMQAKKHWDKKLGLGRQKIFEVRRIYNDVTFIDTFLTPEFCQQQRLFIYAYNLSSEQYEIASREFSKIKKQLLFQLTNFGLPIIDVVDANYKNRSELLLKHSHEGVDLKLDYAHETLKNLFKLWRRPVNIETVVGGIPKVITFDGKEHTETNL